jgi:hypothetical protein
VAKELISDFRLVRSKNFFNLQLKPELFQFCTGVTNFRAAADGAGSGMGAYYDFVLFNVVEVYKLVGIMFANGLTPKPRLKYWFEQTSEQPLFGIDLFSRVMTCQDGPFGDHVDGGIFGGSLQWWIVVIV